MALETGAGAISQLFPCRLKNVANKAIATHLGINVSTVRKHLESIYYKMRVKSRTEAIAQALAKLGLLPSLPVS
jgi:FixJ family two-component response regulator